MYKGTENALLSHSPAVYVSSAGHKMAVPPSDIVVQSNPHHSPMAIKTWPHIYLSHKTCWHLWRSMAVAFCCAGSWASLPDWLLLIRHNPACLTMAEWQELQQISGMQKLPVSGHSVTVGDK